MDNTEKPKTICKRQLIYPNGIKRWYHNKTILVLVNEENSDVIIEVKEYRKFKKNAKKKSIGFKVIRGNVSLNAIKLKQQTMLEILNMYVEFQTQSETFTFNN